MYHRPYLLYVISTINFGDVIMPGFSFCGFNCAPAFGSDNLIVFYVGCGRV